MLQTIYNDKSEGEDKLIRVVSSCAASIDNLNKGPRSNHISVDIDGKLFNYSTNALIHKSNDTSITWTSIKSRFEFADSD